MAGRHDKRSNTVSLLLGGMQQAADILTAALFGILAVVEALHSIGFEILPESWNVKVDSILPKLTLGILAYIAYHLISERLRVSNGTNKRLDLLMDKTESLETRLVNQISAATVFPNREQCYIHLRHRVASLPPQSELYVTHFEKNRSAPFDEGEREAERDFMEIWQKMIEDDRISVRQIVHVSSKFDLDETRSRLDRFKSCINFELCVMVGSFVQPYQDVFIAPGHWVLLALPSDPNNPYAQRINVFIESPKIADSFATAFMANWGSTDCYAIKTGAIIRSTYLAELQSKLPSTEREHLISAFKTIPGEIADLGTVSNSVAQCISLLHSLARRFRVSSYSDHLNDLVHSIIGIIGTDEKKPIELAGPKGSTALIEIVRSATRSIDAVSVDLTSSSFWNTEFGRDYLASNKEAANVRNIPVRRVFVLSADDNSHTTGAINEHESFAECRLVTDDIAGEVMDFIIVDSEVLYTITEQHNGQIERCQISISTLDLNDRIADFQKLWNVGRDRRNYFRVRRGKLSSYDDKTKQH